jgi:hypothetical protein
MWVINELRLSFGSSSRSHLSSSLRQFIRPRGEVIVLVGQQGLVEPLYGRPDIYVSLVDGLEATNFGNSVERPRERDEPRGIVILGDVPEQAQSGFVGVGDWLGFHPYRYF